MADIEICLELRGLCRPVGIMRRHAARGSERVTYTYTYTYTYTGDWTSSPVGFAIDPSLPLGPGTFLPAAGHIAFGAIAGSAPDSWGRSLMRRRERREAEREAVPSVRFRRPTFSLAYPTRPDWVRSAFGIAATMYSRRRARLPPRD